MGRSNESSLIKRLQVSLPRGAPFDTVDLRNLGISSDLAYRYAESGWIERLGRGVFMFSGDSLRQQATLSFLAARISEFHVGGKTALGWQGQRQNLPSREILTLWGTKGTRLPEWFSKRFPSRYTVRELFEPKTASVGIQNLPESPEGPPVSVPERAMLEMLSEVGVYQEVEEARSVIEGLRSLRTDVLQTLLRSCKQKKAVRLSLAWGMEMSLPWVEAAREAMGDKLGNSRWVTRLKDGRTLILKP